MLPVQLNFCLCFQTNPDQTDCHKKITLPSSEHFYMVSQVKWEDDIIWNADDLRNKLGKVVYAY